jgi:hypothetical protein
LKPALPRYRLSAGPKFSGLQFKADYQLAQQLVLQLRATGHAAIKLPTQESSSRKKHELFQDLGIGQPKSGT